MIRDAGLLEHTLRFKRQTLNGQDMVLGETEAGERLCSVRARKRRHLEEVFMV